MNIGKAMAIFDDIESDKYLEEEKLEAIDTVLKMATYNGLSKDKIIAAFRWFWRSVIEF